MSLMLENTKFNPSGRIKPVANPDMQPGMCAVCGTSEHAFGFADLSIDLEFYGTVYLCYDCVAEIAGIWKMVPPKTYEYVHEELLALRKRIVILEEELHKSEGVINGLAGARVRELADSRDGSSTATDSESPED